MVALAVASACKHARESNDHDRARDDARRTVPKPAGPGIAPGTYRVDITVHVEAKHTHIIRSEPDLALALFADARQLGECHVEHTATGTCRFDDVALDVAPSTVLRVAIVDRDGDAILDDPASWGTSLAMAMRPRGAMVSATITLEPSATWWEVNGARVWGVAIGVLAALGSLGAFRKQLIVADPLPPRCSHCNKSISADALTCSHCGAAQ